eukprot:CAMPEP_0197891248 /NCGR_PEP_ID=MMETSP1439-20131203/27773_1 /TAXON_ID=66791 /ORGANISM="Gonyaulax spinifera, Strain CCMP409" /LENGTH=196 /DNA_ID=CAMNT_0043511333 /DNA_START=80 /DNA_END=670 /DNA_ORIENTATION=-
MVAFAAVHAVVRKNADNAIREQAAKKRQDAAKKAQRADKRRKKLIDHYDTNKSGDLDKDQLKKLLSDDSGEQIDDIEVEYYMHRFDRSNEGGINKDEVEGVLMSFHCYIKHRAMAEEYLVKYDSSKTGALTREELKALLTDLNDGLPVNEEGVDFVLKEADLLGDGKIEKPEIVRAVTMWYCYAAHSKPGGCCAVM